MQFDNQKTRNVADVVAKILAGESAKQEPQMLGEELVGNQHKIDANKNKKIDAHDFKLLRAQKDKEKANSQKFGKDVKEEAEQIDELSKDTLKSYAGKVVDKTRTMPQSAKKQKHLAGLGKAMDKMKEEVEELDEESVHKKVASYLLKSFGYPMGGPNARYTDHQLKKGYAKVAPEGTKINSRLVHRHVDDQTGRNFFAQFKMPDHSPEQLAKMSPAQRSAVERMKSHISRDKMKEEVEELAESHFKIGDKVRCKESGMNGEIIKLDKEDGGEDEKYYTFKREDGKVMKKAPNELTKINEETEIDEAMFPGTKEYEKKFGQSPQQKLKKKGDTVPTSQGEMKKTEKGVMHTRRFSEMVSAYQEQGLKFVASLVKEEPTQDEYDKEIKKAQNKSEGKEKAEVAKASVQAVKNEETHTKVQFIDMTDPDNIKKSEIDLEERSLTEPEMKKKEEYVKGMKKKMPGFKERYGERAKEVMYATATKMAKKD